jgi:hypothetical protein
MLGITKANITKNLIRLRVRVFGIQPGGLRLFIAKAVLQEVDKHPHRWTCCFVDYHFGPEVLTWYQQEIVEYTSQVYPDVSPWSSTPFEDISPCDRQRTIYARRQFVEHLVKKYSSV